MFGFKSTVLIFLVVFYRNSFSESSFPFRTMLAAALKIDSGTVLVSDLLLHSVGKFCMMFFVSAMIGVIFGLACALVSQYY